jgi:hypothetical protein
VDLGLKRDSVKAAADEPGMVIVVPMVVVMVATRFRSCSRSNDGERAQ